MSSGAVHQFYGTQAWKACRIAYWRSKGGLCERCLARGLYSAGAEVHHKIRLTDSNVGDPSVSINWDNLVLLCEKCHHDEHNRERAAKANGGRRWSVDEDGHVMIVPPSST